MCFAYLRPPVRRPVGIQRPLFPHDVQGELPLAWCERCGAEVFEKEKELCQDCERRKDGYDEKQESL